MALSITRSCLAWIFFGGVISIDSYNFPVLQSNNPQGFNTLLKESAEQGLQYKKLQPYYTHQTTHYTCGFETESIILNELMRSNETTDRSMLDECARNGAVNKDEVKLSGVSLDQLGACLRLGISEHIRDKRDIIVTHANDVSEAQAKTEILAALMNPNATVTMNYQMRIVGERSGVGHHSPLVASHTASNAILVLDVSSEGPNWVSWEKAWAAMKDENRGYIILKPGSPVQLI